MPVIRNRELQDGYNPIIDTSKNYGFMLLDFGVYKLRAGAKVSVHEKDDECMFLLLQGNAAFKWPGYERDAVRQSFLDENPEVLHVPKGVPVGITAKCESEIIFVRTKNNNEFKPKFYSQKDCRVETFGEGVVNGTAVRRVKTVFDYASAPYSNLVPGEVLNFPGRWSSYPPHGHLHPEFYYYRFDKPQGFGGSFIGDEAYKVMNNDTSVIPGGLVHPQVAAPGYPMYYCWVIRHLENNPWQSRDCVPEHAWVKDKNAKIWNGSN